MDKMKFAAVLAAGFVLVGSPAFADATKMPTGKSDTTSSGEMKKPASDSGAMMKSGGTPTASENKQTPTGGQPGGSANRN